MSALAGFEVVGCGEEEGCEVRAEVGVFGGHQFDLVINEMLADGVLLGHFKSDEVRFGDIHDCLTFLCGLRMVL